MQVYVKSKALGKRRDVLATKIPKPKIPENSGAAVTERRCQNGLLGHGAHL